MPQSIICLDEAVYHFGEHFRSMFPTPSYLSVVTLLLVLMKYDNKHTLSKVGKPSSLRRPF